MCEKRFDFIIEVGKYYPMCEVIETSLREIYNYNASTGKGQATEKTIKKGVYALFYNNELKKIGKSTDKKGIFHRMSQYYRGDESGGLKQIDESNRDEINVKYFNPPEDECWYAERRLQVIAHDFGEIMPWEDTSKN